jgi:hypothetical protein
MLLRGTELEERKHEWGLTESAGSMPVVLSSNSYGYEDWCAMAKISQALKETEGEHPSQIHELIVLSETLDPEFPRFTPNKIEEGLLTSRVEVAAIPNN